MDFELSEEQNALQQGAIEFARSALAHDVVGRDRERTFDREGWQRCAEFGVLGMPMPRRVRRPRPGPLGAARRDGGSRLRRRDQGLLFSINAHLWTNSIPILLYGTEEQRRSTCPGCATAQLDRRQWRERAGCGFRHFRDADAGRTARRSATC